jgi:hypothetical protein
LHDFALSDSAVKEKGFVKRLEAKVAQVVGKVLEKKSELREKEGKGAPEMEFSGRLPEQIGDSWSASEYLIKAAFRQGLRP